MRRFDITMTYERAATVWCPYFSPDIADKLLQLPRPKTEPSPAVYFRSDPIDRSGRGRLRGSSLMEAREGQFLWSNIEKPPTF